MERNERKAKEAQVFKRLKTNNRLKGGETKLMRKFLSVLITVTMVMSLVASFRVPATSAAVTALTVNSPNKTMNYYNPVPDFGVAGTPQSLIGYFYTMGDVITGTFTDDGNSTSETIYLLDEAGNIIDSVTVYTPLAGTGPYPFTLATVNVMHDGRYYVSRNTTAGDQDDVSVYIKYNHAIDKSKTSFEKCATSYKVYGTFTRATGYPNVAIDVYIAYPNNELAGYYAVNPTSGTFAITFPSDGDGDGLPDVGKFRLYVRDAYSTGTDNDAIIYEIFDNTPAVELELFTYVNPTFIYKNQNNQPILLALSLKEDKPNEEKTYITGATIYVQNATVSGAFTEVAPGFYRGVIDVVNVVDVRFYAETTLYNQTFTSNTLVINTRNKGVYNPYVDVTVGEPVWDCSVGRYVYGYLPCTIGTYLTITADYWPVVDPANWYIKSFKATITGPVSKISGNNYRIYKKGEIKVTTNFVAWKRANSDCPFYDSNEKPIETNVCCDIPEPKVFTICEVNSCTYGGMELSGDVVDPVTVAVGKKVDVKVTISHEGAPNDLFCSCPYYVVHMYMVNKNCQTVAGAFTLDTWSGSTVTVSDVWYNPNNAEDTGLWYLPIDFEPTTAGSKFLDCPFDLRGVKFNFPTGTYTLVLQVFGLERKYDDCGNVSETWPMIAEIKNPIKVLPSTTTLNPSTTTLKATGTIWEGQKDPDQILAGITTAIDITNPKFTLGTPTWEFTLNGVDVEGVGWSSLPDGGYRFSGICLWEAGTFTIYGYVYNGDCTKLEEVKLTFEVVEPTFTVKIGLADGSVIDNDGILTEGLWEKIYVTPADPRTGEGFTPHDFSEDAWSLEVEAAYDDCGIPTAVVCDGTLPGECCGKSGGIKVSGYDNPCLEEDPTVDLYFVSPCGAYIYVDSFVLVPPTIKVDPAEVPFTIPSTTTHVTFTVTDAHGHGAPGVKVYIYGTTPIPGTSGSSGYNWMTIGGVTGSKGTVNWGFNPPYSGMFWVEANMDDSCDLPCGWDGISSGAMLESVYQAPVVDTTAPVVTATAPEKVAVPTVKITGKATDNVGVVSVWIGAKKADLAPDGTFEAVVELEEGANNIKVVAYDAAGNKGEATLAVTYEVKKVTVVKLTIGQDIMVVNGKAIQLDAAPEIKDGRTFLPLRAIAEIFGATVEWIPETNGVTVTLGDHTIGLQIGNPTAVVDGNVIDIVAPYIENRRTMVPLRVIAEGLGAEINWDSINRIVTITM